MEGEAGGITWNRLWLWLAKKKPYQKHLSHNVGPILGPVGQLWTQLDLLAGLGGGGTWLLNTEVRNTL